LAKAHGSPHADNEALSKRTAEPDRSQNRERVADRHSGCAINSASDIIETSGNTIMPEKENGVNGVLVGTMTPREAVSLLLSRFPSMRDLVCPDEYCFEEPTRAYDYFAMEVISRAFDSDFIAAAVHFINDIAQRKDPLLRELLVTSLLEGIAANADVAQKISGAINEEARSLLHDVETKIYGRRPRR
jgi:hypothetical protein